MLALGALAAATSIVSIACGGNEPTPNDELRARAKFDMHCDKVSLHYVDGNAVGVRGCGQQMTYVQICRGPMNDDCQWILNTDSSPVQNNAQVRGQ
jgi:hypothetical protein